ncbi:MAG: protein-L-isoaspartate(D-aspartate) O-methyltransferase [Deltaproteobacteria bacterium]|nr:protein-L-isoaspartate(D-aspartate) O-methyltransferase [Candidatus Anaeroferrophillus wilburensis]MBN2889913.1 protein-L-isoaspartate(D-aspartate) O-methyltransferase [Deltaproteobacteria bacterium]
MRYVGWRKKMVEEHIVARGIDDPRIIAAMSTVPRHYFLDSALADQAYGDHSLPIGEGQTMTQPYVVAFLLSQLNLQGHEKVLEIGMGSGYLTALLSRLAERVFTVEKYRSLAIHARQRLEQQNCHNVVVKIFDGSYGWSNEAPFDIIVVSAAAVSPPPPLLEQLMPGGILLLPLIEEEGQYLYRITKDFQGLCQQDKLIPCNFVKLVGKYGTG